MTNWQPDLQRFEGPRYLAIANALAADREAGVLAAGERLPPQRKLAWSLGVTLGTVTRAYAEADRRGLIEGEVGRGTFVRGSRPTTPFNLPESDDDSLRIGLDESAEGRTISLGFAAPPPLPEDGDTQENEILARLARIAAEPDAVRLLGYQPNLGSHHACAAGARWLTQAVPRGESSPVKTNNVAVTAGAQHGLLVTLAAATQPGDRLLAENFTYPGFFSAARLLGRKVEGVAMDEEGLIPEALALSLEHRGARVLYTIPTLQNPTSATQPLQRRREIVEICRAKGVVIIEDDVFGHYRPDAPLPYLAIAPEITYSLASLSKTIAPGLRISFLAFPESERARVAAALQATAVMAPPLMAELAAQMIEDGTASRLLAARRKEAVARGQLVQKILAPWKPAIPAGAITAWLTLPEPWRAQEFVAAARGEGVVISPAEHFTLSRHVDTHAVRLCLGPPKSQDQLRQALKTLARLLESPPLALNQTML